MTFAVVPAGGKSTRMGRPKLTLPLGDRTVIEHVVGALRQAEVDPILVVAGPHVPDLVPLAEQAGAKVLVLAQETPDMRATVEAGLSWLEDRLRPEPEHDWLLVPADHPTLDGDIVRKLQAARATSPHASTFVPIWMGRRGHPTLLTWKHVAGIRALAPGLGLNVYLREHKGETCEVPADSAMVLADLDTWEQYTAIRRHWPLPH